MRQAKRDLAGAICVCSYIGTMTSVGIRNLKNQLSRYVRRVAAGERVVVTDRGGVVAELVPPSGPSRGGYRATLPALRLPPGTAAALIDEDRGAP